MPLSISYGNVIEIKRKMSIEKVRDLVGIDLSDFKIIETIEVYRTDYDGRYQEALGFFKNEVVASAFAGPKGNSNLTETRTVLVLTNGTVGFTLQDNAPVKFFNDEEEALKLRQKALDLLTPEQRKLLGV